MGASMMPQIQPVPGQQAPAWLPQPGERGMPPAPQPQYQQPAGPQMQPYQGPTPGWGPPSVPPVAMTPPQDYGTGYPVQNIPPAPQRAPNPFAGQPLPQQPQPGQQPYPPQPQPQQPPQGNPWQQPVPQPQPQGGQRIGDPNLVLDGPGIPVEIRGRTLGEAISMYTGLRNVTMNALYGPGLPGSTLPQAAPPQQQPHVQAPAAPSPQAPGQAPGQQSWDWRNPQASIKQTVEQAIQETVVPILAPIHQQNLMSAINNARNQIAQQMGPQNFAQVEPEVLGLLQGVDPRYLANPQTWNVAVATALGMRTMRGSATPAAVPTQANGGYPVQQPGPGQNPMPNLNSFFTERPGATARQDAGPQPLSPMELYVAQQMGKSPQEYMAWKGGMAR